MNLTHWRSKRFGKREGRKALEPIELFQGLRKQLVKSVIEQVFAVVL